jgi:hypothetical protein
MSVVTRKAPDGALSVRVRDEFGLVSGRVHPPVVQADADLPALIQFGKQTMSIDAARVRAGALLVLIESAQDLNRRAARRRARDASLARMVGARLPNAAARSR